MVLSFDIDIAVFYKQKNPDTCKYLGFKAIRIPRLRETRDLPEASGQAF